MCSLAVFVPWGMIYMQVTWPLPLQPATKRIMAMNKSAVAIDHPVILSDMQSANVTPLFINRAAARTVRGGELCLRGWRRADLRVCSYPRSLQIFFLSNHQIDFN